MKRHWRSSPLWALSLTLVLLLATLQIFAQSTATVAGQLKYRNGRPAARVVVIIGSRFTYTDAAGAYRLWNVPYGRQTLVVRRNDRILKEIRLDVNQPFLTYNDNA